MNIEERKKFVNDILERVDKEDNIRQFFLEYISKKLPEYPNKTTVVMFLSELFFVSPVTIWRDHKKGDKEGD